jgi:hypothetical protein
VLLALSNDIVSDNTADDADPGNNGASAGAVAFGSKLVMRGTDGITPSSFPEI